MFKTAPTRHDLATVIKLESGFLTPPNPALATAKEQIAKLLEELESKKKEVEELKEKNRVLSIMVETASDRMRTAKFGSREQDRVSIMQAELKRAYQTINMMEND